MRHHSWESYWPLLLPLSVPLSWVTRHCGCCEDYQHGGNLEESPGVVIISLLFRVGNKEIASVYRTWICVCSILPLSAIWSEKPAPPRIPVSQLHLPLGRPQWQTSSWSVSYIEALGSARKPWVVLTLAVQTEAKPATTYTELWSSHLSNVHAQTSTLLYELSAGTKPSWKQCRLKNTFKKKKNWTCPEQIWIEHLTRVCSQPTRNAQCYGWACNCVIICWADVSFMMAHLS